MKRNRKASCSVKGQVVDVQRGRKLIGAATRRLLLRYAWNNKFCKPCKWVNN